MYKIIALFLSIVMSIYSENKKNLDYKQVIDYVLKNNLSYKNEALNLKKFKISLKQSKALFPDNPSVGLTIKNVQDKSKVLFTEGQIQEPIEIYKETSLNPKKYQDKEISINQEIYLGSKRKSQILASQLEVKQKEIELEILKRSLAKRAIDLIIQINALKKSHKINQSLYLTSSKIYEIIEAKASNNLLPQIEKEIAESEMIQNKKNLNIIQNDLENLKIQLSNLMGGEFDTKEIYLLDNLPKVKLEYEDRQTLIQTAFKQRLEITYIKESVKLSQTNLDLQKKMSIPNPSLTAALGQSPVESSFGISLSIPINIWKKNKPNIEKRKIDNKQILLTESIEKRRIKKEVIQAENNYKNYNSIFENYSKELLQRTNENLTTIGQAIQQGNIELNKGLLMQKSFISVYLDQIDAEKNYLLSTIEILNSIGYSVLESLKLEQITIK